MYIIAIHGGAGTTQKGSISAEQENNYHKGIEEAIRAGVAVLASKGTALDAVEAAVCSLENNPLFNAGKGAAFSHEGRHELEAAIMCGKTLEAGAVVGLSQIKNPISLARAVMEKSPYVMLSGKGAEEFAREQELEFVSNEYFSTDERYQELQKKLQKEKEEANAQEDADKAKGKAFGTVGAVALDVHGNLAAATSTGGLTNKRYGRIGDSSLIGCGTYANNHTCAVSCTGDGEFFIRTVAAHEMSALLAYKGVPVQDAANQVIHQQLQSIDGEGGLIAVDRTGNTAFAYNSPSMYRGSGSSDGTIFTAVFEEIRFIST
jgi:beta-aspartyl-peptidase (threonine type)